MPELYLGDGYELEGGDSIADLIEICGADPERKRPEPEQLAAMERVTQALRRARPRLQALAGSTIQRREELLRRLREATGARAVWGSYGPRAIDVTQRPCARPPRFEALGETLAAELR